MNINNLSDFAKAIVFLNKEVEDNWLTAGLLKDDMAVDYLYSEDPNLQEEAEDEIKETLDLIEVSGGHYLFDDYGFIDQATKQILKKHGIDIVEIGEEWQPIKCGVKTDRFIIPIPA